MAIFVARIYMRKTTLPGLAALVCAGIFGVARAELPPAFGAVDGQAVWVDFWASWCAPCRRSFPWMNEMHGKYADAGLTIIAVNVDKERELADEFLDETPAEFRVHFDPAGALAEEFGVQAMPSSFLLDADGNVVAAHYGFKATDTEDYEQAIRAALGLPERHSPAPRD
jgi:thiol-disulfide isomerase/thioredoxin